MNKKIKIIELLSRIKYGEELPKRIRYKDKIYTYNKQRNNYYYRDHEIYISECLKDILDLEVEILEDNTEEIEELPLLEIYDLLDIHDNRLKINEIIRYIKRKEVMTNNEK